MYTHAAGAEVLPIILSNGDVVDRLMLLEGTVSRIKLTGCQVESSRPRSLLVR